MAKYDITHSCGHTETVQLFGAGKERESRIAYLEKTPCAECKAIAQVAGLAGEWVEMHYGEYKTNHSDCVSRGYNPETKTILVFVKSEPASEIVETSEATDEQIAQELIAADVPEVHAAKLIASGSVAVKTMLDKQAGKKLEGEMLRAQQAMERAYQILRSHNR